MVQCKLNGKPLIIFIFGGLFLNVAFLFFITKEYHAISMAHGNVAFNVYRYNIPGINTQLTDTMYALQDGRPALIDFDAVRDADFGPPDKPFPVNDTVGYGVLLGLLWKITHSLSFSDIIFLQILMYLIMIYLIYQIGLLLFASTKVARYATIAFLCYAPLIALSVHAVRDVWAAYGLIVLMYVIIAYLKNKKRLPFLLSGCIFFAFYQWIRPSLFLAVITATLALIMNMVRYIYLRDASVNTHHERERDQNPFAPRPSKLAEFEDPDKRSRMSAECNEAYRRVNDKVYLKKTCTIIATLWIVNILIFWLPFMYYNKAHYGRYFVSPAGQDLLEGLGEFTNPWGHQLSDEYVAQLIENKYGSKYGTPQFDDDAKKEFLRAYHEQPQIFCLNMIKRLPMLVLPALPWMFHAQSSYAVCMSAKEKLIHTITHPSLWFDFFARHVYVRMYVLLGYLGLGVLLWRRKYGVVIMIGAVLMASMAKLPSHIEYRYLTPYYWVLCFAIGYVFKEVRKTK